MHPPYSDTSSLIKSHHSRCCLLMTPVPPKYDVQTHELTVLVFRAPSPTPHLPDWTSQPKETSN